jgi:threonine/homoserine/homoserine lactone efflux protein
MDYGNLLSYLLFLLLWMLTPDISFTMIARTAVKYGFKGGFFTVLGMVVCDGTLMLLSVIGVAEFLLYYPKVLNTAKIIGGIYIFYTGLNIIWTTFQNKNILQSDVEVKSGKPIKLFMSGLLINASNPMVIAGLLAMVFSFFNFQGNIGNTIFFTLLAPFSTLYVGTSIALTFGNPITRKFIMPYIKWFERFAGTIICLLGLLLIFK